MVSVVEKGKMGLNVLESFLLDFPGCLIIVSHDRYFMDKITDHLFVFKGEGVIDDFPGNYSDYRAYESSLPQETSNAADTKKEKKNWREDTGSKLSYNEQKELKSIESKLKDLEFDKKEIEAKFHDTSLPQDTITELSNTLQNILTTIEEKEMRWMELVEKMES